MKIMKVLLAALMIVLGSNSCSPPQESAAREQQHSSARIQVTTASVSVRTVPSHFQATGAFAADESSAVAPAVGGRVESTPIEVGDFVKKGQALCILERRDAQLKLDQARAGREQAKFMLSQAQSRVGWNGAGSFNPDLVPEVASSLASYESARASAQLAAADARRYENLVKSGDVSQSNYEKFKTQHQTAEAAANSARKLYEAQLNTARQNHKAIEAAEASLAAAESQLAQAEKTLADTIIRSPFDGFVTERPVSVGQWVGTVDKVATVVRIATVRLQLQVPEQRAGMVTKGMSVTARVAAYPNRDFYGKVTAVVASVDSNARSFMVEARFDNPKTELRPGMFTNAKLMLQGSERAVFVPSKAVFYDNTTDANHVYSIAGGVARLNVVLKGDNEGDQVRILSGMKGDETVAIDNQASLYDGVPVQIR